MLGWKNTCCEGIVRLTGREVAEQKRSRFSRGELTPFGERRSTVLFKYVAAVEVAVLVEMVVDRGMSRSEFLEGLYIPEPGHRSFPSPERLVGIFGPIVKPPAAFLICSVADDLHR